MTSASPLPLIVESRCTVQEAEALRLALLERLGDAASATLRLDLSGVEEADVSLLHLLVALRRTADAKGATLDITTNPFVDALLARAGLAGWWQLAPAA